MASTVWGVFNGGSGYTPGSPHELRDIEEFSSLSAAGGMLWARVAGRESEFPGVERETASMHVWFAHPNQDGEVTEYPDRIVTIGPRGGIRVERA